MRPRLLVAFFLLTLPIWFIPAMVYVGWLEDGRYMIKDVPAGLKWVVFGKKPTGY